VGGLRLAWVGHCEEDAQKTVRPVAWAGYGLEYVKTLRFRGVKKRRGAEALPVLPSGLANPIGSETSKLIPPSLLGAPRLLPADMHHASPSR
jgi:hypothetical protein